MAGSDDKDSRDQDDAERQRRQASWFDWLKGFLPDFSFFGLIEMALVVTGIYFFAKTEMGQKMFSGLTDMLPESWQATVKGFLNQVGLDVDMRSTLEGMDYNTLHNFLKDSASAEILEIIDPNDGNKTLKEFFDIVADANATRDEAGNITAPGKITTRTLMSDKTMIALIQKKPDMAMRLVQAAMKPNADGTPNATGQEMVTSVKAIIAGPQLDQLVANAATRENTIKVLVAALPADAPVSADGLRQILSPGKGLTADGKPTDALRKLLTDAVDASTVTDDAGKAAAKKSVTDDVRAILGTEGTLDAVDTSKLAKGSTAAYVLDTTKNNAAAKTARGALFAKLGEEKTNALLDIVSGNNPGQIVPFLLKKENVAALPEAVALLKTLPNLEKTLPKAQADQLRQARSFLTPDHIQPIINIVNNNINPIVMMNNFMPNGSNLDGDRIVNMLMNPERREEITRAGTENIAALGKGFDPMVSKRNLDAIIKFVSSVDGGKPSDNSKLILHRIARLIVNHQPMSEAFKGLTGAQLAAFFNAPGNLAAFHGLFDKNTGLTTSDPVLQKEFEFLRSNFSKGNNIGLDTILKDAKFDQFLIDGARGGTGDHWEITQGVYMYWNGGNGPANTADNRQIVIDMGKTFNPAAPKTPVVASAGPKPGGYIPVRGG